MTQFCTLLLAPALKFQSIIINLQPSRTTRVKQISEAFGKTPGAEAAKPVFLLVFLSIVGVVAFFLLRRLFAKAIAKSEAEKLFLQLCKAHNLSRRERQLLRELAAEFGIDTPPAIFVRETIFQKALTNQGSPDRIRRLEALHAKLFV